MRHKKGNVSNLEYPTQSTLDQAVVQKSEIDVSSESLDSLLPQKLLALYPDAKVEVIQPTHSGKTLTLLISSATAVLEPVTLGKSILGAYEGGLLYCSIEYMSLKGESSQTVAYIPKYDDRQEIRHRGINAEFYQKLYAFLKDQGVRYVLGQNRLHENGSHTRFFLQKLGRLTFDELPAELAAKIPARFLPFKSMLTVQVL